MSHSGSESVSEPLDRARVLLNVLSNWGAFAVNAVIAFFLSPYIVRSLGAEVYGAWVLVGSLVGYLGLLDIGVRGAVTKFVAAHHAARAHDEASRIASAALAFFGTSGLARDGPLRRPRRRRRCPSSTSRTTCDPWPRGCSS